MMYSLFLYKIKALDQISKLSFGLYALGCQVLFSWREKMDINELYKTISELSGIIG